LIPWIDQTGAFPEVERALRRPNGLLAAGGDLSSERLLTAYRSGIFPWYSEGEPILWWSPDPRMVLYPSELKIARSLAKTLRKTEYETRADTAFAAVINACSEPRARQRGTWITDEMKHAYIALHRLGVAHSVETWRNGELIGGLYGIALGRVFFGESMFSRASDASKVALVALVQQLRQWEFGLIDCQMNTPLLASFGAREIPRREFTAQLAKLVNYANVPAPWTIPTDESSATAGATSVRTDPA
jgi:leucyl/phenylalanyl-tRNA--protein transferase